MSCKEEPQELTKALNNKPCDFCNDNSKGNFVFIETFN